MRRRAFLTLAIGFAAMTASSSFFDAHAARCTPSSSGTCNACKNCRYCGHCAKGGGTCSVCKPPKRPR